MLVAVFVSLGLIVYGTIWAAWPRCSFHENHGLDIVAAGAVMLAMTIMYIYTVQA